jgi:hypothetical protein
MLRRETGILGGLFANYFLALTSLVSFTIPFFFPGMGQGVGNLGGIPT